jgi:hypothetical protein
MGQTTARRSRELLVAHRMDGVKNPDSPAKIVGIYDGKIPHAPSQLVSRRIMCGGRYLRDYQIESFCFSGDSGGMCRLCEWIIYGTMLPRDQGGPRR